MKTPAARANTRKQAKRQKAQERAQRLLNLKKQREPLIPDKVLKRLASLGLPPSEFVYQACLEKLMREA